MKNLIVTIVKGQLVYLVNCGYVCSGIDQHLYRVSVSVLGGHM